MNKQDWFVVTVLSVFLLLGLALTASAIAYVVWDFAWWSPVEKDAIRLLGLLVLHSGGLYVSGVCAGLLYEEIEQRNGLRQMQREARLRWRGQRERAERARAELDEYRLEELRRRDPRNVSRKVYE